MFAEGRVEDSIACIQLQNERKEPLLKALEHVRHYVALHAVHYAVFGENSL